MDPLVPLGVSLAGLGLLVLGPLGAIPGLVVAAVGGSKAATETPPDAGAAQPASSDQVEAALAKAENEEVVQDALQAEGIKLGEQSERVAQAQRLINAVFRKVYALKGVNQNLPQTPEDGYADGAFMQLVSRIQTRLIPLLQAASGPAEPLRRERDLKVYGPATQAGLVYLHERPQLLVPTTQPLSRPALMPLMVPGGGSLSVSPPASLGPASSARAPSKNR